MTKLKTNRAAAKRFKKTASGKYVYDKAYGSHLMSKKNRKRKRNLRKKGTIRKSDMKEIRQLLPNG
jgi:large subunit ribosomal protein L35